MSDGERMVWAAAFAASVQATSAGREPTDQDAQIANDAAFRTLTALRFGPGGSCRDEMLQPMPAGAVAAESGGIALRDRLAGLLRCDGNDVDIVANIWALRSGLHEALDLLVEFMDDSVGPTTPAAEARDPRVVRLRKLAGERA